MSVGPRRFGAAPAIPKGMYVSGQRATGTALRRAHIASYSYGQEAQRFAGSYSQGILAESPILLSLSTSAPAWSDTVYVPDDADRVIISSVVSFAAETEGTLTFTAAVNGTSGTAVDRLIEEDAPDYSPFFTSAGSSLGSGLYLMTCEADILLADRGANQTVTGTLTSLDIDAVALINTVVRFEFFTGD